MSPQQAAAANEVYRQGRWRASPAFALGFVGVVILLGVNLANQWPLWGVVALACVAGGLVYDLFFKTPTEVRLSQRGLTYSGGIPARTVFISWDKVSEIRKRYEPAAFGAGPLLSAVVVTAPPDQAITITRAVDDLGSLAERIEAHTIDILLPPVLRSISSGASVPFGPLTVGRATGVSGGTLLQKRSIPLSEVSGWTVEAPVGMAATAGPMLIITGSGKNRVVVLLADVRNPHVLFATLADLKAR